MEGSLSSKAESLVQELDGDKYLGAFPEVRSETELTHLRQWAAIEATKFLRISSDKGLHYIRSRLQTLRRLKPSW
jgi:hypothetical protein